MPPRRPRSTRTLWTALVAALAACFSLPGVAGAQELPPPDVTIGIEVRNVDAATRTVGVILHCVPPEMAGKPAAFRVAPAVDITTLRPGAVLGVRILRSDAPTAPGEIVEIIEKPCAFDARPPRQQPGARPPGPGGERSDDRPERRENRPDADSPDAENAPEFDRGFLRRVWKFTGEADGYQAGKLSITIAKVLNLPKRFGDQDDDLVDEDAIVLLGTARVYEDGKRVDAAELKNAERVRVHGKLLAPSRWSKDEDGEPVATIRAKKVYIVG